MRTDIKVGDRVRVCCEKGAFRHIPGVEVAGHGLDGEEGMVLRLSHGLARVILHFAEVDFGFEIRCLRVNDLEVVQ